MLPVWGWDVVAVVVGSCLLAVAHHRHAQGVDSMAVAPAVAPTPTPWLAALASPKAQPHHVRWLGDPEPSFVFAQPANAGGTAPAATVPANTSTTMGPVIPWADLALRHR